ncbi:hypothetical protein Asppvi_005775 [Aspergillus pseudoviridinutans]|uniref:Bacteriophage T5 Orf172 DNA-binding domain-containing protein n=1 Tax=Aspergillus pseudoviridinutans TaxID=1517512 RepID=A0A9P3B8X4_9EURO|nr:uncharacterized protein Asppvi_005775 [Aspergillus pseudoviridinutans]GIJ86877.1 hypothetical protein Asppvi_005775 [Aspergillus pseudoviridinutans]
MSGEEIQLNLEPPSTPIKGPARQATLNGTQSPLGSASSDGVISSPPSPEESLFSPTHSTATDITDDYGWHTPVKVQALSTTLDTDSLESSRTEEDNDSGGDVDRAGQIAAFNVPSPTKPLERSKRAKSLRPRVSISSLRSEDATKAVLSKRKESSTSPVDTHAWVSDQGKFLEGITWPSIQTGQKTPKRSRHIRIEYWTSEQARNINTDFSAEGTWILRPRAASEVGGARKFHLDPVVSCTQDQCADQPSSSNSIVPTITVSPPEDDQIDSAQIKDDEHDPRSKSMSSGDGTVKAVLTLLSIQKASTSAKDKDTVRKSLHSIIPLEIRERLREDDQRCPAQTAKGLRCKNCRRGNVSIIMQSLDSLTTIKSSEVLQCMEALIPVALCSSAHQRVAQKELKTWEPDIDKLCDIQEDQGHVASHTNYRLLALADWINTLGGGESFLERVEKICPPASQESIPNNIPQVSTLIQKFIPYVTKASVRLSVSEALEKLLVKPLMKSEIERVGSVYVYWQPGNFGHLKIGYSNEISKRVNEWSRKCLKPMEVYFPKRGSDEEHLQVSHVCRVEKLVHTELKNCRRIEEMCPGCKGNHNEWFEVSRQLAIAVVRKWMAWMRTSPYEERSCGGKTEWVLKDEQRRKIKELSQPLQEIAISRQDMEKRGREAPLHAQHLSVSRAGRARSPRMRSKSM